MIQIKRADLLKAILEGTELRLYSAITGTKWTEPAGYSPVPLQWSYQGDEATAQHRIEFAGPAKDVIGWLAVKGQTILSGGEFDRPMNIRVAGDAITVKPTVSLDLLQN